MSVAVTQHKNYIGGEWVDSAGGETMEVLNPATGETIAEVPASTAEDADRAVQAAKQVLPEWLETTPGERAEMLLKLADVIEENADELAELESRNVGKPLPVSRDEPPVSVDNVRFFAGAARVLEGRAAGEYMRGYTSMIRREPIGVVAGIAPWNYPLMMAIWKLGPALAAGNVQVLKPSEQTPLTALRLMELAEGILPPGVLNVITGDGVPVGEALVKHPDVRLVSLTGDVETGKEIARTAADNLKRVHLELGGKAPVLVFDDADPAAVAASIKIAGYWNSGQDCTAASRVVAGPKIYDKLLEELVPAVESLQVGDPADGRRDRDGPGHLQGPAGARLRLPRACQGRERPHGRRLERRARLLRHPDGHRGRRADGRDRAARGLRPGRDRAALRRRRPGDRLGERRQLRPRRLRVHPRRRPGAERRPQAPVRDGVDQRPHPARLGDAARRLQAVGLRQGPLDVLRSRTTRRSSTSWRSWTSPWRSGKRTLRPNASDRTGPLRQTSA